MSAALELAPLLWPHQKDAIRTIHGYLSAGARESKPEVVDEFTRTVALRELIEEFAPEDGQ